MSIRGFPLVASASSGHVWDARTGIELARFHHTGTQILWFDGVESFRTASSSEVRSWRLPATTPSSIGKVARAALSEDNQVAVVGGFHNLALVRAHDRKTTALLNPDDTGLVVAVDGRGELAAADTGKRLIVWRLEKGVPAVAWA